ncbi:MAG: GSCFA domain-containing protein [Chthoniobacterales bacterium]
MPLYSTSGEIARSNARSNPYSRWYHKEAAADEAEGKFAFQRLRSVFFTPSLTPKFQIRRSDKLFAIGSCFARGIEKALQARKFEVLSAAPDFDSFTTIGPQVTGLGFTNKYNTFSIANELKWALDPVEAFPEESILDLSGGVSYDPHTNPVLPPADRAETLRRRSILRQVNARIASCRVVVMTLGLVEVWRDLETNTFINTTPPPEAIARYPRRYEFHVSNFAENLSNLETIHGLLSRFGHRETQIVTTVSPVPLMATFSDQDIVIANTYSKSLLRTAAQEWAAAHDNVHYFPSYEIVMNSARDAAWLEDLRHVQGRLVNHIMDLFVRDYLE